jgi:hypothetical protein
MYFDLCGSFFKMIPNRSTYSGGKRFPVRNIKISVHFSVYFVELLITAWKRVTVNAGVAQPWCIASVLTV